MKPPALLLLAAALTPARAHEFTVHEWGTFTTVSSSDGTHLDGVQNEEAPLPPFVRHIDGLVGTYAPPGSKGISFQRPLAHVNVRMETPVVYFYTDRAFDAQVDVQFHGGMISQWFPERSAGEKLPDFARDKKNQIMPKESTLDFGKPRTGSIRWNVRVEPAGEDQSGRVFQGGELPCWLHPRATDSALVTNAQGQTDKYLFYRGLGHLTLPVTFTSTGTTVKATNTGAEPVGQWLLFDLNARQQARWIVPPAIPAAADGQRPEVPVEIGSRAYQAGWKKALYADAVKMLVDAGLYRKEADAMLQTWWDSYFLRPGIRIFWVVPRGYVDKALPLTVSPPPAKTERVIVGRSEILTPAFEQQMLNAFASVVPDHGNAMQGDRFFPAYSTRVDQLHAAGRKADPAKWAGGKWAGYFQNGVQQTVEVAPDGSVKVTEPNRTATGRMVETATPNVMEVRYSDDRVERWSLSSPPAMNFARVEHWVRADDVDRIPPVTGSASKQ